MTVTETQGPRFDFGRVTSRIGALIGRNLVPFLVLSLILAGAPYFLFLLIPLTLGDDAGVAGPASLVATLVLITGGLVLQAAITRASIDELSGKQISIGAALSSGVAVALPLLGFGLLFGLGVGFGLLLLIVPGVYLALLWAVSCPIIVVERLGVFKAMARSGVLTQNHRWAILGLIVLYMIFALVVQGAIALAIPGGWATMAGLPGGSMLAVVALVAFQAFSSIVGNVGIAAIYFELRQIKEGVDVTELANVFA
jgi:Membrane domain of glycerophosphoryl diester phosphodiesterase